MASSVYTHYWPFFILTSVFFNDIANSIGAKKQKKEVKMDIDDITRRSFIKFFGSDNNITLSHFSIIILQLACCHPEVDGLFEKFASRLNINLEKAKKIAIDIFSGERKFTNNNISPEREEIILKRLEDIYTRER